jgi:hypothetical protein
MTVFGSRALGVAGSVLALVLWLGPAARTASAQGPGKMENTMKKMLTAVQTNSYEDFVAAGDAAFKAGMTKQMLEGVSQQLGPRLQKGYTTSFLGSLEQHGFTVYLWKC